MSVHSSNTNQFPSTSKLPAHTKEANSAPVKIIDTRQPASTNTHHIHANQLVSYQVADEFEISPKGFLVVSVLSYVGKHPLENASIELRRSNAPEDSPVILLSTDKNGRTEQILLDTPERSLSLSPSVLQPYTEYDCLITLTGYESAAIMSFQMLEGEQSRLEVELLPASLQRPDVAPDPELVETFIIGPHTLYGNYPPKIAEAITKPLRESNEIVLNEVVIPEYIVVHDGPPSDSSAEDYYVPYKDYIKNVASSEIYATWPEQSILANVLAIQSFTLNRVYTEWYRNQGYFFTITSSTAFDQKYIPGRNIFESISRLVDQYFSTYITRPTANQPLLTQYCDGKRKLCPGFLSQWGSKDLGESGYYALEILKSYYGNEIYLETANSVSGVPVSFPGTTLTLGSSGNNVRTIQRQLNDIAAVYTGIPLLTVDGNYGQNTEQAVKAFQRIFSLPASGQVDYATWYKISEIYVALTRLAQL